MRQSVTMLPSPVSNSWQPFHPSFPSTKLTGMGHQTQLLCQIFSLLIRITVPTLAEMTWNYFLFPYQTYKKNQVELNPNSASPHLEGSEQLGGGDRNVKTYQLLTFSKRKHPCKFKFQTLTIIISTEKWEAQISSWGSREISTYIFSMVKTVLTQKWYLLNIYPFSDTRQAYHINDHSSFNPFRQGWLLLYTGRTLGG